MATVSERMAVVNAGTKEFRGAGEREEEGELESAARVVLRVLETRTGLYLTAHPDVLT